MDFIYEPVHFVTNARAMEVINGIQELARDYGFVTVADLYDVAGMTRTRYDEEYGWPEHKIMDAYVIKTERADYMINLPLPMRIDCKKEPEPIGSTGMPHEAFKALLEELDGNSVKTLAEKNARYSQNGDALHNFRSGAEIAGGTPAQACWGYLTKHLVALRDMVEKDDFSNREDFLEKCQDSINYIRFLWCIGNDTTKRKGE